MKYTLTFLLSFLLYGFIPVNTLQNTFGYIKGYYQIKTKSADDCIACYSSNEDVIRINKINEQLSSVSYVMASAFVIMHKKSETFLMTSGHVCSELKSFNEDIKFKKFSLELQDMILKREGLFEDFQLFNFYFVDTEVVVYSYDGTKFKLKEIKAIDKNKDMCIISTESEWGIPVMFAKKNCEYEEIYNMSASGGYYYPNAVPIRKGIINKVVLKQKFEDKIFENVNLYTLNVKPGSSGSAVFNKQGEVCGSINISYSKLDLSSGASRVDLIDFFQKHKNNL